MSFKCRFILRMIESAMFISTVCGIIWFIFYKVNYVCNMEFLVDISLSDMYYTQISVSFIIISLVSVLTNVSRPVYWVDITQFKLIEPRHTAFMDFSAYILGGLVISSMLLVFNSNYMLISFGFSIMFMMLLTIKMIGAYFGRDSVKKELEKKIDSLKNDEKKEIDNYSKPEKNKRTQKTIIEKFKKNKEQIKNKQSYAEICSKLEDKTYQEIDNKEYRLVSENLDLLINNDEYSIVIDILRYISENMVNIYCKYAKKYLIRFMNHKPDDCSQEHLNRFFQLAYTNLMKSIENDLQETSVCLYSILLKGRNAQFTQEEFRNTRHYTRGQYWKRIEPALSAVYRKCINEDKYDLLDELLYAFYREQLAFRRKLCNISERNTDTVGNLFALYMQSLGMETIIRGLFQKVSDAQIDSRQINMLINSIIKIYHENEVNREKNKDAIAPKQLSEKIYDEHFVDLIKLTYEKKLLDENMKKKYSVQMSNELQTIFSELPCNDSLHNI